jgi:hypothetical protein
MRYLLFVLAALFVTAAHGQALVIATCGSGSYPVGQLHQLTMNPAGYLCVSTTTALGTLGEGGGLAPKPAGAPGPALGPLHPPEPPKPLTAPPGPAK